MEKNEVEEENNIFITKEEKDRLNIHEEDNRNNGFYFPFKFLTGLTDGTCFYVKCLKCTRKRKFF